MKKIKITIIIFFIISIIFFATYRVNRITIEGSWSAEKIVLNGKQLYPRAIDSFFDFNPKVIISDWTDSIQVSDNSGKFCAAFSIKKKATENYLIILSSKESSLNGNFKLKIDTTDLGPQAYRINVEISSKKTYLRFQRDVIIPPWKPEFPRRGQV